MQEEYGIENAQKAAEAVNGVVAAPDFTKEEKEQGLSDWNDLDKSRGREAARSILVNEIVKKSQSLKRPSNEKEMGMAV